MDNTRESAYRFLVFLTCSVPHRKLPRAFDRVGVFAVACALAAILSVSAFGQTGSTALPSDSVRIKDSGQNRVFEIARDEIELSTADKKGVSERIAATSAEGVRQYASKRARDTSAEAEIVLYEKDVRRTPFSRRILTKDVLARLAPGTSPADLAVVTASTWVQSFDFAPGFFLFRTSQTGGAIALAAELAAQPGVLEAEPLLRRLHAKRNIPNDPFFQYVAANAGYQWHLNNTGQNGGTAGIDVNVTTTWGTFGGTGIRGAGIKLAIVDDGLQTAHPDLAANLDTSVPTLHHDWNDATPDTPDPNVSVDKHGTSCAGVAAARGNNSIGVSGAAPEATLVGLRLIGGSIGDTEEAAAFNWRDDVISIKSNSWGPSDDGQVLEGPGSLAKAALANAAATGRGNKGTIFVWAGGNGGDVGDNSNYDGYANSIYTIAVGALSDQGARADYSEPGANLVVCAPSSSTGRQGITTVDLLGNNGYNKPGASGEYADRDYTATFGGTSSACPLAAGVIALILQKNPNLGWRDVQEILIASATKVSPTDAGWITNGGGFHFNPNFGAGLINAGAAVALAGTWTNLPAATTATSSDTTAAPIPDNSATGITKMFNLSASALRIEQVTVSLNFSPTHPRFRDLDITLTSPSGTASKLCEFSSSVNSSSISSWTFMTVESWGEVSTGNWTLKVADRRPGITGTLTSATLTVYGTPTNAAPSISSALINPSGTAFADQSLTVSAVVASDPENNPITLAYQWQFSTDNTVFSDQAGATGPTLAAVASNSGKVWRCRVTPSDASSSGQPFFTGTTAVNNRPSQITRHGLNYTYDSDLVLAGSSGSVSRDLIINEFSQGTSGAKEWIELLVVRTANLQGWHIADSNSGTITLSGAAWSSVPAGTLIVVYNGVDKDTTLPADETTLANKRYILPHTNSTFFTGATWPALSNSSADAIVVTDAANAVVDALSYNAHNVYDPKLGSVGTALSAHYNGDTDVGADNVALWSIVSSAAGTVTPGNGNGGINTQLVADLRSGNLNQPALFSLAPGSDALPGGLTINSTTGLIAGTVNQPLGGYFSLNIQRSNGTATVSQQFDLLVGSADSVYTIPAGKTFTLNQSYTLTGALVTGGQIVYGANSLTVQPTLASWKAANLGSASASNTADDDHDGRVTLGEYGLGTSPTNPFLANTPSSNIEAVSSSSYLTLSFKRRPEPIDILYTVEVTDDPSTGWNSAPNQVGTDSGPDADGLVTVKFRDNVPSTVSTPRRFIRLNISPKP